VQLYLRSVTPPRHQLLQLLEYNYIVLRDYLSFGRTGSTSTLPCAATTRLWLHALYVDLAVRRDYSSPAARALRRPRREPRLLASGCTRSTSTSSCTASTRLHSPGCSDLPQLRRASGCLGTSRGSSRGSSRRSSSTTPGSSSTISPPPRVRVPRHIVRLVTRLVAPLVVDYFTSAVRSDASAHRAARHAARRAAHHRLLRARRRLLRLPRAARCLGTSRGSSRHSPSTTSPTPRIRVPRHVARPVVDYSVHRNFLLRPHWLYFSHAVRRDYLSRGNTGSTSSTPHAATTSSSGHIALTIHLD
jgi:hypothetical protein